RVLFLSRDHLFPQRRAPRSPHLVQVLVGELGPDAVSVELYAEAKDGHALTREPAARAEHLVGSAGGFGYTVRVPATRPVADYTPPLVPQHRGASVPLEAPLILWHVSPSWRRP